ncbi:hypothetical protein GALMADRAFT_593099 [Galerina marginata CBS 339.88]|uniref:Uncharacterized protein n=1 Tax=Galerina marginata (strain CBS 339.88) TaxID=685588 RepID=A0A067T1R5_GALM3|nr:hypothetical protein GALMADRAFT_593099 [Galerina marginata CBS 339.88]
MRTILATPHLYVQKSTAFLKFSFSSVFVPGIPTVVDATVGVEATLGRLAQRMSTGNWAQDSFCSNIFTEAQFGNVRLPCWCRAMSSLPPSPPLMHLKLTRKTSQVTFLAAILRQREEVGWFYTLLSCFELSNRPLNQARYIRIVIVVRTAHTRMASSCFLWLSRFLVYCHG